MGLFNRKPKQSNSAADGVMLGGQKKVIDHPNTPVAAFEDGANKFAEIYGSSMVSAHRFFLLSLVSLLLALLAVGAVMGLTPLKSIVPYIVEVDGNRGVVSRPIEVIKMTPNTSVVKAELARWAEAVFTIDPLRTNDLFKKANARARDKAISQFTEFRVREKVFERMQSEPGLVREVKVSTVDASQPGIAFIFLTTTERNGNGSGDALVKRHRLTLHYQLDPATQEVDLLANPLGIYVIFFNESEEKAN